MQIVANEPMVQPNVDLSSLESYRKAMSNDDSDYEIEKLVSLEALFQAKWSWTPIKENTNGNYFVSLYDSQGNLFDGSVYLTKNAVEACKTFDKTDDLTGLGLSNSVAQLMFAKHKDTGNTKVFVAKRGAVVTSVRAEFRA